MKKYKLLSCGTHFSDASIHVEADDNYFIFKVTENGFELTAFIKDKEFVRTFNFDELEKLAKELYLFDSWAEVEAANAS